MPDILHDLPVAASPARVFRAVSAPEELDRWWTRRASGPPVEGAEYELWFGPRYDWRARVTQCLRPRAFELELTRADADWLGTHVGFTLEERDGGTEVRFHHTGWPEENAHYRVSSFCWAMYLRLLKRHVERGESVPYDQRLDA
jgi:uncharacterized protein YndB with AHSA1/START domain